METNNPSFGASIFILSDLYTSPQTTLATTNVSVKEENREETHHPKDEIIKQEEIQ
uniref:Uncharacterized protein n=1 Tax=Helianthus annuus TaxID=4232 RepID=A0A251UM77_HELAN